jgi:hypothetical protein
MTKSVPLPPIEQLQEWLDYDPVNGIFTWQKNCGNKRAGLEAGGVDAFGYRRIRINTRKYQAQRIAWIMVTGEDPGKYHVDHINCNPLDNSFANLRLATNAQNACNRGKPSTNSSGYKGVTWKKLKNKWSAQIMINYKKKNLGYFNTPEEAHAAYCKAAKELHGDFARVL